MLSTTRTLLLTAALLAFAGAGHAATTTLLATDSGWHSSSTSPTSAQGLTNFNYNAGWADDEFRNFFVFDLSGLPAGETLLSATLRAYNPADGEPDSSYEGGYDSPDASETYQLREILLPASTVGAPGKNAAAFADLGDGAVLGTYTFSASDNGFDVDVTLNAAGISYLQGFMGIGEAVLGGHVDTLTSTFGVEEFVWGHTDPPGFGPYSRELIVSYTPEPGTGALLAMGLVAMARARRMRRA